MKSPITADPEPYLEQSISAGGQAPSAKAIFEQRKSYAKEAAAMGEISEYKVEHLATFLIERKDGMMKVEDSIRKLKLLEARGKVWTQEICLYVDDKAIKIFDETSKDELEHYSITSIQHVQAILDECVYKSICALVIKEPDQRTGDIHLFNCPNVPAEVIVADISSAFNDHKVGKKGHKMRSDTLSQHREVIRASNSVPAPKDGNVQKKIAEWQTTLDNINDSSSLSSPRSSNSMHHESSAEMVAFKIHREVEMLNHGLDDIEVFVSKLQKAAEATKQLTVRSKRSSRKNSKKNNRGGVLELRSRLPPEEIFVDCFQKFKFCFNLLAKLKSHIKNPNAVELVHFLFQPLNMVVFTCGGPALARSVVSPLFSRDTIAFLQSCTTSDETAFWRQLGNFWNMTRSEFPKENYFIPYIPQFNSGWEPPPLPSMGPETQELAAAVADQADQVHRAEEAWKASGSNIEESLKTLSPIPAPPVLQEAEKPQRKISIQPPHDPTSAFKQHVDSHIKRNQAAQNGQPQQPRDLCRAMHDFEARNEHELSIRLDELLDVLDRSKSWWKVQNKHGEQGYVPQNLVLLISASGTKSPSPPSSAVLPPPPPHLISPPPVSPYNGLGTAYNNNNNNINKPKKVPMGIPTPMFEIPPPPVVSDPVPSPQSPPVIYSAPFKKKQSQQFQNIPVPVEKEEKSPAKLKTPTKPKQSPAHLQEELKQRVESQQSNRNFVIPKKRASSAGLAITANSSSSDVKHFLNSNGFSRLTIDSLGVLNGAQLFSLTKNELKEICDEDGTRVHSQLLIQQSLQNERAKSQESELDAIMRRRRQNIAENGAE